MASAHGATTEAPAQIARAILPSRHRPPISRPWQQFGLPESGWVVLFDVRQCRDCRNGGAPACARSCASAHHLPPPVRKTCALLPPVCIQCATPPCAAACPVDAITSTPQGVVLVDQELCIGCRFCADACPTGGLVYLDPWAGTAPQSPLPDYSPLRPDGRLAGSVFKCTLCADRLLGGNLPYCAQDCPNSSMYVGNLDLDTATNGIVVRRLSEMLATRQHVLRERVPGAGTRVIDLF